MHVGDTVSVDVIMDGWDHLTLWVGVFAALASAFAAFAAWRTVVIAERQLGAERQERRIAQALLVYAELELAPAGPLIHLRVTNASAYPVSGVRGTWHQGSDTVQTIGAQLLPAGESVRLSAQMSTFAALAENARFEVHFTDVAGVQWKRLDMDRPVEIERLESNK